MQEAKKNISRNVFHASWIAFFITSLSTQIRLAAAEIDLNRLPPAAAVQIDYTRDVQPILERSCFGCHGSERQKSDFRLDDRDSALKGGDNGTDIVPGDSSKSALIYYVARLDEEIAMPPEDIGEPLTSDQIGILRAWIDQGAKWGEVRGSKLEFTITPMLRWMDVSGDKGKFREIEGIREGFSGGIQQFSMTERVDRDKTVSIEGHALPTENGYRVALELRKPDLGFARGGFEVWRKYYDDNGTFAPTFPTNFYSLDRDLYLDRGRAWVDFGLTLPDKPQIVIGYEYQFKKGNESTLQLGPVGTSSIYVPDTDAKHIYPASKHVDEDVHILKADFAYELGGWKLEDSARVEFYSLRTRRDDVFSDTFAPKPDVIIQVDEHSEHTQGMNTLSASKQIKDWWRVSGAYYYSRLDGVASVQQTTLDGYGNFIDGPQWSASDITFERETHSGSVASTIGPWSGLTLSLAGQGEWQKQRSAGFEDLASGSLDPSAPPLSSDASRILGKLDSTSARETIGLRYTTIPYSVLFAEARLRQERLGRFEDRPDNSVAFVRESAADIAKQEYRAGFNTSPWTRVSLSASFVHSLEQTDYTHLQLYSAGGYKYPGFMLWRDIEANQFETRLAWRAARWLQMSLNYRFQKTDYDNSTAELEFVSPGGQVHAARQEASVVSASAVLTPFSRLFFSGTISYADTRLSAQRNDADYLVPYDGQVFSLLTTTSFALNQKTDLRASYNFSTSDYGQSNKSTGLPAGIEYDRHGVQAAITHRFSKNVSTSLTYWFSRYSEPTAAGRNDYTAHGLFASVALTWR